MADPNHVEALDSHDVRTVVLYRTGLVVSTGALIGQAVALGGGLASPGPNLVLLLGVALILGNLHLYDKTIRWFMTMVGWTGAILLALGVDGLVSTAGLGFLWVVLSAVALKERLCFRVPGLAFVPWLLAPATLFVAIGQNQAAGACLSVTGAILGLLAFTKIRQPLHFDVGDKSRYQV